MFNMHSNKNRRWMTTVMIIILVLAMIVPTIAAFIGT